MNYLKKHFKIGKDFLELLNHSKNYILAQFLTLGLAFLTLPIFTRLMSPDEYGVMSVFTSFEGIIAIIFGLGVRGAISRYYYEDKDDFFDYLSSNIWLIFIASIGLTGLAILFRSQLQTFLNIPFGMIYIAFGIAIPQAIFQLYQSYLQASKKSKKVATLNVIRALLATGLAIAIMLQMDNEKYYAKAIGQGIGALTLFLVTFFYLKNNLKFSIKKEHLSYSLVFGLPIILHLLSQNILNTFDQIIINQLVGQHETGIYSVAYKIGMVQSLISMGILKAWTPIFYDKLNKGKYDDINALAKKYAFIVMLVAIFLIFFAKEIITILADKSYHEALGIIPIIIISYFFFFLYTMYVNYAFYEKKTKNIAAITIIIGLLNITLNYLLIPHFGYIAAAWTTLISYISLFILHYINVKYVININKTTDIKIFVLPVIILSFIGVLNYYITTVGMDYGISLAIRLLLFALITLLTLKTLIKPGNR